MKKNLKPLVSRLDRPPELIVGLDPGLDGGIGVLNHYGAPIFSTSWLTHKEERPGGKTVRVYDVGDMLDLLGGHGYGGKESTWFALERQQAMPGQGVTSMFSTGYGYGLLVMGLSAVHAKSVVVRAAQWQSAVLPPRPPRKKKRKDAPPAAKVKASKDGWRVCEKLWPAWQLTDPRKPRARTPHDGICDALLMAEALRRWLSGELEAPLVDSLHP